jgi:hypothetical protein
MRCYYCYPSASAFTRMAAAAQHCIPGRGEVAPKRITSGRTAAVMPWPPDCGIIRRVMMQKPPSLVQHAAWWESGDTDAFPRISARVSR